MTSTTAPPRDPEERPPPPCGVTAVNLLTEHADDPPELLAAQTSESAGWDVWLRIDSGYATETAAADAIAYHWRCAMRDAQIVARFPRIPPELPRDAASNVLCPVCGKPSGYLQQYDRIFHADGSGNDSCWLTLARGTFGGEAT